jgi:NADPH:quinone reductase-like Zn-dependent oxidoreductase
VRAAYVDQLGDAASIRYGELPDPVAGPGQVLVRVDAVAVDNVDLLVRSGAWRTELAFPLVLGRDLVGTVAAGERAGEPVWTNSAGYGGRPGATSELVAVDADRLYSLPSGADPVAFVAALHAGATAHGGLRRAGLAAGETLAVFGANGAVGCCLVQRGAELGARVVAVVRDGRPADRLRALGAAEVLIQSEPAVTDVPAVDVLIDASGRVDLTEAPAVLRQRGRILLIAGRGPLGIERLQLFIGEQTVHGFIMSGLDVSGLADAAAWINQRRPFVAVGGVASFADTRRVHEQLEAGRTVRTDDGLAGKFVLRP